VKVRVALRPFLPWMLLAFLAMVLITLYFLSARVSSGNRVQVELQVRQALGLDTRVNLEVLRLRHRQLLDYDSLAISGAQAEELLQALQTDFERIGLPGALQAARESWRQKQREMEDFKRQNAVLNNSLQHFVNLATQLHSGWDASWRAPASLLNSVTRDVLILSMRSRPRMFPALLPASTASRPEVGAGRSLPLPGRGCLRRMAN